MRAIDDLIARWPMLGEFLKPPGHLIELPFRFAEYDDADGNPGWLWSDTLVPRGLRPPYEQILGAEAITSTWADPPFPQIIFTQGMEDPTLLICYAKRIQGGAATWASWGMTPLPRGPQVQELIDAARWQIVAVLFRPLPPRWHAALHTTGILSVARFMISRTPIAAWPYNKALLDGAVPRIGRPSREVLMQYYTVHSEDREMAAALIGLPWPRTQDILRTLNDASEAFLWRNIEFAVNDATWMGAAVVTACSLVNARNVAVEATPTPPQSRAARRRGEPPPVQYHRLVLRPFAARRARVAPQLVAEADPSRLPIHWVRGHFKAYTPEKPLFGRITGLFWWQPHLAGRGSGRVEKDYVVAPSIAETA